MLHPPTHPSMAQSAPAPAQCVVQPPVVHFVAQSEPEVQVDLQPPLRQFVLQVAASHARSQPPSHVKSQEAFRQKPGHSPPGQPRLQLALVLHSKEQGSLTVPMQARLHD